MEMHKFLSHSRPIPHTERRFTLSLTTPAPAKRVLCSAAGSRLFGELARTKGPMWNLLCEFCALMRVFQHLKARARATTGSPAAPSAGRGGAGAQPLDVAPPAARLKVHVPPPLHPMPSVILMRLQAN